MYINVLLLSILPFCVFVCVLFCTCIFHFCAASDGVLKNDKASCLVSNILRSTENLEIGNWVETRQNGLVLSPIVFTLPTRTKRQDKTVLSCLCRRCEQAIRNSWHRTTDDNWNGHSVEKWTLPIEINAWRISTMSFTGHTNWRTCQYHGSVIRTKYAFWLAKIS